MQNGKIAVRSLVGLAAAAAAIAVPLAALSGVASADPGLGWGAPGPGILPGLGLGGVGGPASGVGVLPGPGLGGVGGPASGVGVLPGAGVGLPGAGLI